MCIIISKASEASHPTDEVLHRCWAKNPDGAGIAYATADGGVNIIKGLMTVESLIEAMSVVRSVQGSMYLVHFRIGTHGTKDETNTHPFWVDDGKLAVVHNGILPYSSLLKSYSPVSDTNAFTEDVLRKLPKGWQKNPIWVHVIEEYMGRGNKIATITNKEICLLNLSAWNTDNETGLVYSNLSWKSTVYSPTAFTPYEYPGVTRTQPNHIHGNFESTSHQKVNTKTEKSHLRSKDVGKCHRRMASMVKQGAITSANRQEIGILFRDMSIDPEEAEEALDFVQEQLTARPADLRNMDDVMKSEACETVLNLIDHVASMRSSGLQETISTGDSDDAFFGEELSGYNEENSLCFVGKMVRVTTVAVGKDERLFRVERLTSNGLHYRTLDNTTGFMVYTFIASMSSLLQYDKPTVEEAEKLLNFTLLVQADGAAYTAILKDVSRETDGTMVFNMCLGTGVIILEPISQVRSMYVLAEPVSVPLTCSADGP